MVSEITGEENKRVMMIENEEVNNLRIEDKYLQGSDEVYIRNCKLTGKIFVDSINLRKLWFENCIIDTSYLGINVYKECILYLLNSLIKSESVCLYFSKTSIIENCTIETTDFQTFVDKELVMSNTNITLVPDKNSEIRVFLRAKESMIVDCTINLQGIEKKMDLSFISSVIMNTRFLTKYRTKLFNQGWDTSILCFDQKSYRSFCENFDTSEYNAKLYVFPDKL